MFTCSTLSYESCTGSVKLFWENCLERRAHRVADCYERVNVNHIFYFAIVDAVVVGSGIPDSVASPTFSIVNSIKSSTTALRSFVSR